jgi:DNA topoisomerase I
MRNRHVEVRGGRLQFRFRGKRGKFHEVDLTNKRLARIVKRCQDLTGYELFQYIDDAGEIRNMTSEDVNDYLRAIAGEEFSAKDFRTWAGTTLAAKILQRLDEDDNEEPTESALVKAIDAVAAALGNTRCLPQVLRPPGDRGRLSAWHTHAVVHRPIVPRRPNWFKLRRGSGIATAEAMRH